MRHDRIKWALVACLALINIPSLPALAQSPASKSSPPRRDAGEDAALQAAENGLTWLRNNQHGDGSWSDARHPVITALCLLAFQRSTHPARTSVCEKAAGFVASNARKDGGIYKAGIAGRASGVLSVYNTSVCMAALHDYNAEKYLPLVLKAREFIAASQVASSNSSMYAGGFGYDRTAAGAVAQADLYNTAWALMAMRATQDSEQKRPGGRKVDINWPAVITFLKKMQTVDKKGEGYGGFGYEMEQSLGRTFVRKSGAASEHGYGTMTYAGLTAMIYAQVDKDDPRVRSALDWACRHWTLEENPGSGKTGVYCYYNIMARSLSLMGDTITGESGTKRRWKRLLIEKLVTAQQPTGQWINTDSQFWEGDPTVVTAYSVLALLYTVGDTVVSK